MADTRQGRSGGGRWGKGWADCWLQGIAADLDCECVQGKNTALHLAVERGLDEVVQALLGREGILANEVNEVRRRRLGRERESHALPPSGRDTWRGPVGPSGWGVHVSASREALLCQLMVDTSA